MARDADTSQRRWYRARRAKHCCTDCNAPVVQSPDGRYLSRCESCVAQQYRQDHERYLRHITAHRCTNCPAPAHQDQDGHWFSLCERCAAIQRRGHQQRYLRLLAVHKCVSCQEPAMQHADGSWYTRCPKHMLYIATYDGAQAAKKAAQKQETPR